MQRQTVGTFVETVGCRRWFPYRASALRKSRLPASPRMILRGLAADFVHGRSSLRRFFHHAPAHRFGPVKTGASLHDSRA
jgi:hypothetical protein